MSAASTSAATPLTVVGIGCDGIDGLSRNAARALEGASRIIGSPRQLNLLRDANLDAELTPWPAKFWQDWAATLADINPESDVIIASGDPMFHGVGTSLVRELGQGRVRVIPAASSVSLACAYLGWALDKTPVVSLVTGPGGLAGAGRVVPVADKGQPFLVLCRSAESVEHVAAVLTNRPDTVLTAMTNLGGIPGSDIAQSVVTGTVAKPPRAAGDLTVLAVEPAGPARPWLKDEDFDTDGQLTKSPIREITVAALAPRPGALLWDIGGGTGTIGIEFARHGGHAITVEMKAERADRIARNGAALSGNVTVIHGKAPEALTEISDSAAGASSTHPDAIFIGGGLTAPGMIESCMNALADGGVLVANTVTLESERLLWDAQAKWGGEIRRIGVERAHKIGSFTAWKAAYPVVQWVVRKAN